VAKKSTFLADLVCFINFVIAHSLKGENEVRGCEIRN
jgi:hypothetical protein